MCIQTIFQTIKNEQNVLSKQKVAKYHFVNETLKLTEILMTTVAVTKCEDSKGAMCLYSKRLMTSLLLPTQQDMQ